MRPAYLAAALAPIALGTIIGVIIHTERPSQQLEQTTKCMFNAVKTMRGVSDPVLSSDKGPDGTRPLLVFHTVDGATWAGPTRIGLEESDTVKDGANWSTLSHVEPVKQGIGRYYFRVEYTGPPHGQSVTGNIVNGLEKRCGVEVRPVGVFIN
jgi:hypothetical protein